MTLKGRRNMMGQKERETNCHHHSPGLSFLSVIASTSNNLDVVL